MMFILAVALSLVTTNIISATITQTVYAKKGGGKGGGSSGGDKGGGSSGGGGSSDSGKSGGSDNGGGLSDDKKSGDGGSDKTIADNTKGGSGELGGDNNPPPPPVDNNPPPPPVDNNPPPPPVDNNPPPTCPEGSSDCQTLAPPPPPPPSCDPSKEKCDTTLAPPPPPPPPPSCDPSKDPSCKPTQCDPSKDPSCKPTQCDPSKDPSCKPTQCDPSKDPSCKPTQCESGYHREGDTCVVNGCHKDNMTCGDGGGGGGGGNGGSSSSTTKTVVRTTVIVRPIIETTVKNFIAYNIFTAPSQGRQPTFLLLLDTAQLCQIAGDVQCVTQQNQFKARNLITKLDSTTGRSWIINGQAENVASSSKTLTNIQVVAHFYDSRGNNVGGLQQVAVTPGTLKALQSGVFNIKADTSRMSGIPAFLRLEFQSSP